MPENCEKYQMTLMHEHVTIDLSGFKNDKDCRLDCFDATVLEFKKLRERGITRVADVTNTGMGRDIEYAAQVAEAAGVTVFFSTGYYKEPFFPPEVYRLSEKRLAAIMRSELETGIGSSGIKAAMIAEIGTGVDGFTVFERKVFRAAARAHCENGATISTHTTLGRCGLEQIDLLTSLGVEQGRIIIGHADLSNDCDYIEKMLSRGVNVGFDTIGKNNYLPDNNRVGLLVALCARGYSSQIVLSMDITRKSQLAEFGGIGYSYLPDRFVPMLRAAGVNECDLCNMLVNNPERLLQPGN